MERYNLDKKDKYIILLLISVCILSCQKMKYGTITTMWHEPENTYISLMPVRIGKTTALMPFYIHDNEDWCIIVKGISVKGDSITKTYYVSKAAFDTLSVGKFICVDGACNEDNNNTKTRQ